jgi:hypothetical protein
MREVRKAYRWLGGLLLLVVAIAGTWNARTTILKALEWQPVPQAGPGLPRHVTFEPLPPPPERVQELRALQQELHNAWLEQRQQP